jgi:hypothetical protein
MVGNNARGKSLLASVAGTALLLAREVQAHVDQIPKPPVDELIPHGPVVLFGLFNLTLLVLAFGYLAWATWRTRSVLPLAFLAGGCLGGFVEPIFDGNIHVMFAQQGQQPNWYFYNVGYPWFEVPGNGLMGAPIYWLYQKFRRGISTGGLWRCFVGFYLFDVLWEIPGTAIGSYLYYGPHPFVFFGFPVWIGMLCGLGLPAAGYVAYVLSGALSGARLWVMIAILVPVTIYGSEVIAWPMWITLNGAASVSLTRMMALLSLAFTLSAFYCMTQVYAKSNAARAAQQRVPAPAARGAAASFG